MSISSGTTAPLAGDTATDSGGSLGFLIYICIVSAMGGLLFGYDTVVISGTVDPVTALFGLSPGLVGFFVSSALIGCFIGAAIAGWLADSLGRKKTLVFASLLLLISAIGCGFAWDIWSLIFFF